ncbi:MAG: 2-hydroxyacyl-CoA dehydratase family protein [Eubacteriales bacterium]|nr:2-hydroxyacyl-CoA dehydratase family protein [Eubacteriales bacterium]
MTNLQENLEYLEHIANNPKKQLENYRKAGKDIIGTFPYYTPEVLADAAGIVPMGMWGAQTEISQARKYLVAFACPIMQSCMELGLNGSYCGVKAVMIPAMCDTLRCVTQDFKMGVRDIACIPFTYPQNRRIKAAVEYLAAEFEMVKERIEEIYGVRIEDERIQQSIAVYNEHSASMRRFSELAKDHLDIITPVMRHAVFKSAWFMTKAEHLAVMKKINEALVERPLHCFDGRRVVLTGITAEPEQLLQILADQNLAVVGDDVAQESRQYRTDIPEGGSGLERLAKQWMERIDPMAHDEKIRRVDLLEQLLRDNGAQALIVCMMKFCDPEEYEFVAYNRQLREHGWPVLSIDIDQQPSNYDQARTRIQTLAEML